MDAIGVLTDPDHPVFGGAAERLAARGFHVDLYPPTDGVSADDVAEVDAFATAVLSPDAIATLQTADRAGVETFNGAVAATVLGSRFPAYSALEAVGCQVIETWPSPPAEVRTRRRDRFHWPDPGNPSGGCYEAVIPSDPVRRRYYAVDDGVETHVTAIELKTRLRGREGVVEHLEVDVERATRLRTVLARLGARAVAVDFAGRQGDWYAVDVDPAPDFVHADMERHLADALASLTTIGA